ncbi:O-antigen ligase family protein [Vibrio campbellii]|uniref:O-antigen ligase family protein n=1 Tax=Vibrio campbellii TaxID=680 RepID=UPI0038577513
MMKSSKLFSYYLVFVIFGYVAVAPVSHFLYQAEQTSIFAILYRVFVVALSIIFVYLNFSVRKKVKLNLYQKTSLSLLIIFCFLVYLRLAYDFAFQELINVEGFAEKIIFFGIALILLPCLSLISDDYDIETFFKYSGLFLFFSILISLLISFNQLSNSNITNIRFGYDRLNPITLGTSASSLILISIALNSKKYFTEKIIFAFFSVGFFGLVLSGSRGAILSFLVCVFVYLIFTADIKKIIIFSILTVVVLFLSLYLFSLISSEYNYIERLLSTGSESDQSANIRFNMYRGALEQFTSNPMFGDFILERGYMFYPHNQTLEVMMSTGVFGLTVYLLYHVLIIFSSVSYIKTKFNIFYFVVFLLYIQALVGAQFSGSFLFSSNVWFFSLILVFSYKRTDY